MKGSVDGQGHFVLVVAAGAIAACDAECHQSAFRERRAVIDPGRAFRTAIRGGSRRRIGGRRDADPAADDRPDARATRAGRNVGQAQGGWSRDLVHDDPVRQADCHRRRGDHLHQGRVLGHWDGAEKKVVCKATEPGKNGVWGCKANLLALGVPPGEVTFTFDVGGVGVPVARSPDGSRRVTYAVKPPRPTKTHLQQIEQPDFETGDNSAILHRVQWSAPDGYADEFLVYETFECPRPSIKENSGKPCFVAGTPVDSSKLELRAKAAGDASSVQDPPDRVRVRTLPRHDPAPRSQFVRKERVRDRRGCADHLGATGRHRLLSPAIGRQRHHLPARH